MNAFGQALVARPVGKAERLTSRGAQEALRREWDRLRASKCWDEDVVRESSEVEGWGSEEGRHRSHRSHLCNLSRKERRAAGGTS